MTAVYTMVEPFAMANPVAGVTESVGLGLSVAHSRAKLISGRLSYRRHGHNNIFELRLPSVTTRNAAA